MKQTKIKDERVVAETNRIYKIGFHVFTFGILLDLLIKSVGDTPARYYTLELLVFMAAQFVCLITSSQRGIYTEDEMAETFHWKKHILALSGAGLLAGIAIVVRNGAQYGAQGGELTAASLITLVSIPACTLAVGLPFCRLCFAWAKARREKQAREMNSENDE